MSAPADPELLARIQEEQGIGTGVDADLSEYASHLFEVLTGRLDDWLRDTGAAEPISMAMVWASLLAGSVVLALVLARLLHARRRQPRRRPAPTRRPATSPAAAGSGPDPFESALARGDARAALAELWATLAEGLARQGHGHWAPDLTEREFIAGLRAREPDYAGLPELQRVGRLVISGRYSAQAPALDEVRAMVPRARALLQGTPPSGGAT